MSVVVPVADDDEGVCNTNVKNIFSSFLTYTINMQLGVGKMSDDRRNVVVVRGRVCRRIPYTHCVVSTDFDLNPEMNATKLQQREA
jgi:hypothetical protein